MRCRGERGSRPAEMQSFYDDIGFSFTAETDDLDVMVGNFIYNFQGGSTFPGSQFLGNGWVHNNLIVVAPKTRRGSPIEDNNFHRTGMNPSDFYGYDDLVVTRKDTSVEWRLGDIVYTCSPPTWHLGGSAGGVEFDVHFRQMPAPAVWSWGTRHVAGAQGLGGGYCYVEGEGTIRTQGRTLELRNVAGVHERLAFTTGIDTQTGAAHDTTGFGAGMAIHILEGDVWVWALGSMEYPMVFLTVDGEHLTYLPGQPEATVTYTPLDPWHDRRSGLLMPSRWQLTCESPQGRLELELTGTARGYYPWDLQRGYRLMYWFLCNANGRFIKPDGTVLPIVDRRAQHEIVRHVVVHDETLDGPFHVTAQ